MSRYKTVTRCRGCGKIYPRRLPQECTHCGMLFSFSNGAVTGSAESVKAKRTITGRWKVEGAADAFTPDDVLHKY